MQFMFTNADKMWILVKLMIQNVLFSNSIFFTCESFFLQLRSIILIHFDKKTLEIKTTADKSILCFNSLFLLLKYWCIERYLLP